MLIALLFFAMMLCFDYLMFRYRGKFVAFIFAMLALGTGYMMLTAAAITTPTQFAQITISSPTGNTIIGSYNVTAAPAPNTLRFLLPTIELVLLVQFFFVILSLAFMALYYRRRKYGIK